MKKSLILSAVAFTLIPTLTLAHGPCGYPPSQTPNFCSCFITTSVSTCKTKGPAHGIPPAMCQPSYIRQNIKNASDPSGFCQTYVYMFPDGVDQKECTVSMRYYKNHC